MKNKLTNYMIKELAENFKKGFYIIPLYSRKKRIYNTLVIHNLENELGKCCRFFIIYNNSNELSYKETVRLDTTKSFDYLEEVDIMGLHFVNQVIKNNFALDKMVLSVVK